LKEQNSESDWSLVMDYLEDELQNRDVPSSVLFNHPTTPSPRTQNHNEAASRSSPQRELHRPPELQLRDGNAAIPLSQTLVTNIPTDIPGSASAEISSYSPVPPRRRLLPDPIQVHESLARKIYPSGLGGSSSEYSLPLSSPTAVPEQRSTSLTRKPRVTGKLADGDDMTPNSSESATGHVRGRSSPLPLPLPHSSESATGHASGRSSPFPAHSSQSNQGDVRGRNLPFPLPITYDFAPGAVQGSARTPYSYF
jgi:hypothetical protein